MKTMPPCSRNSFSEPDCDDVISSTLENVRNDLKQLADFLHAHPETGHHEVQAVKQYRALLERHGFTVETPYGGLPTAFRCSAGAGEPTVAFFAEYDALAELGHACGHNLLGTAALGAFLATAAVLKARKIPGKVVLFGTPAEETEGGKCDLLRNGAFEAVDFALGCHPYRRSGVDVSDMAVSRFDVYFTGHAAHAASAPSDGINALDAMTLLLNAVGLSRQQMPRGGMIHGIITDGGRAANIIPDRTSAFFYLRGTTNAVLDTMERRFRDMVRGAALMTACRSRIVRRSNSYTANHFNPALGALLERCMQQANMRPEPLPSWGASTDFANLSWKIPAVAMFFNILDPENDTALHTAEFARAAGGEAAFKRTLSASAALALAAEKLLTDSDLRAAVRADFRK